MGVLESVKGWINGYGSTHSGKIRASDSVLGVGVLGGVEVACDEDEDHLGEGRRDQAHQRGAAEGLTGVEQVTTWRGTAVHRTRGGDESDHRGVQGRAGAPERDEEVDSCEITSRVQALSDEEAIAASRLKKKSGEFKSIQQSVRRSLSQAPEPHE